MGSIYLLPTEYTDYGVDGNANPAVVRAASQIIDAHLGRPEGLVYKNDASGQPCYYTGINPRATLTASAVIAAGTNVRIPYVGLVLDNNFLQEVLILDRGNDAKVEACVVIAVEDGYVTLASVKNSHSSGCTMDLGMVIMEESTMPEGRSVIRMSRPNPIRVLSGAGRYGYGRRSQQVYGDMSEMNLLMITQTFGGPPLWTGWDPKNSSISYTTGEIWVPAGLLVAYYTDVRVWYLSGFTQANLPDTIKQACANIIRLGKDSGLGANVRSPFGRSGWHGLQVGERYDRPQHS
jgi:hypothetical protein